MFEMLCKLPICTYAAAAVHTCVLPIPYVLSQPARSFCNGVSDCCVLFGAMYVIYGRQKLYS